MTRERIVLGGGSRSLEGRVDAGDPARRCRASRWSTAWRPSPGQPVTSAVRLRPVEDADLPIFLAHQEGPVAAAMAAFPTRAPDAFFEHWATIRADPTMR